MDEVCHRAVGRHIHDCRLCRVRPWDRENGGGWLPCPPSPAKRKGFLPPANLDLPMPSGAVTPQFSGDICHECGSPAMVRTGTCMTCQECGETSGCS